MTKKETARLKRLIYSVNKRSVSTTENTKIRIARKGSAIYNEYVRNNSNYNGKDPIVYFGSKTGAGGTMVTLKTFAKDIKHVDKVVKKSAFTKGNKATMKAEAIKVYMRHPEIADKAPIDSKGEMLKRGKTTYKMEQALSIWTHSEVIKDMDLKKFAGADPSLSYSILVRDFGRDYLEDNAMTARAWAKMSANARREWLADNQFGIRKDGSIYYWGDSV